MRSIRTYLNSTLLAGSLALWMVCGAGIYFAVRGDLISAIDRGLLANARMLAALIEDENGQLKLNLPEDGRHAGYADGGSEFYQIRDRHGRVMLRSPSLDAHELGAPSPPSETPQFFDFTLPNGQAGRGLALAAPLAGEHGNNQQGQAASDRITIVVATDETDLHGFLWRLVTILGVAAAAFAVGLTALVTGLVARGVAPLKTMVARADSIDADSLEQRFPAEGMPEELQPICGRLNDLLVRLEASFERERRFSSDVAHELRTPIAELRLLVEVAQKWPDDRARTAEALHEAGQIALQMESIASALLALMRCETGVQPISCEPVDLRELVEEIWRPLELRAAERGLRFAAAIAEGASLVTDRALLRGIIVNLLGNAVDHRTPDGTVGVSVALEGGTFKLVVTNQSDALRAEDLAHLFQRYWRKNKARNDSRHSGLGLSLAQAFARALGFQLSAALSADSILALTLSGPVRASEPASASI